MTLSQMMLLHEKPEPHRQTKPSSKKIPRICMQENGWLAPLL